jgi:hypothetical protein
MKIATDKIRAILLVGVVVLSAAGCDSNATQATIAASPVVVTTTSPAGSSSATSASISERAKADPSSAAAAASASSVAAALALSAAAQSAADQAAAEQAAAAAAAEAAAAQAAADAAAQIQRERLDAANERAAELQDAANTAGWEGPVCSPDTNLHRESAGQQLLTDEELADLCESAISEAEAMIADHDAAIESATQGWYTPNGNWVSPETAKRAIEAGISPGDTVPNYLRCGTICGEGPTSGEVQQAFLCRDGLVSADECVGIDVDAIIAADPSNPGG